MTAQALWCTAPGEADIRPAALGPADGVLVEMLFSGISRGTERLVFAGRVPETEWQRMRCPHQEGAFPFPVKYGYCAVGRVAEGPQTGREVFTLHPHQTRFRVPEAMLAPLPDGLPPARAILAANMETALNILWDSGAGPGDDITVVGAGVVGLLTAFLAARLPGARVTVVDVNTARARQARAFDCDFKGPADAPDDQDVVIHLSASPEGLATALDAAAVEATIVEASWYGTSAPAVPLGGAFHSRRLRLVSSQVGQLPPARRPRWSHVRRINKALSLLKDARLDVLLSGESGFEELPRHYPDILADPDTLCHRVRYAPLSSDAQ